MGVPEKRALADFLPTISIKAKDLAAEMTGLNVQYKDLQGQNPIEREDFVVISGKHSFTSQKHAVYKKLVEKKLLNTDYANSNMPKPELVNLIPNLYGGRVDNRRRNIRIY